MLARPASIRLVLAVGIEPARGRMEGESGSERDSSVVKDAGNVVRPAVVPMRLLCLAGYVPALTHVEMLG